MLCSPQFSHHIVVQNIIRYIAQTPSFGLWYPKEDEEYLEGFSNADYGGDLNLHNSTSAYMFTFGYIPILWYFQKQSSIAHSSCESIFRALAIQTYEAIWFCRLKNLAFYKNLPTTLWCNNQSSIKIARNPVFYDKTILFKTNWHFSRTIYQLTDIFTKVLSRSKFELYREKFNLKTTVEIYTYQTLKPRNLSTCFLVGKFLK
jgi:hypothetical protein